MQTEIVLTSLKKKPKKKPDVFSWRKQEQTPGASEIILTALREIPAVFVAWFSSWLEISQEFIDYMNPSRQGV